MRKWLYGVGLGAIVIAAAVVAYALFNLSSIVAANRDRILTLTSDALGRPVRVEQMRATISWGVSVEITGLRIADDPSFSQFPFLTANEVSLRVEFFPLLAGRAKLRQLDIIQPNIRILRNARGDLNLSTLGRNGGAPAAQARPAKNASALAALSIKAFDIDDATILYNDLAQQAAPIKLHGLALAVTNFRAAAPFDVDMKLGFLGQSNVEVSGKVGPVLDQRRLQLARLPVDLKFALGPVLIDKLRKLTDLGARIPPALSITDQVSIDGILKGPLTRLAFEIHTDLTQQRIAYAALFDKPPGVAMTIAARGTRTASGLEAASAELRLATLDLRATKISIDPPVVDARLDTNRFGLAEIAAIAPVAASYGFSGSGEIHGSAKLAAGKPNFDGAVLLRQVSVKSGPAKLPAIADLNSTISFAGERAIIEPTTLTLGSAHLNLNGNLASLNPLSAGYALAADSLKLGELFPERPAGELMNRLVVTGTAEGALDSPNLKARIVSPDGTVNQVAYHDLDLDAEYGHGRVQAHPLKADVFGGSIVANANAVIGHKPSFSVGMKLRNVDLEPALRSQKISASNWIHGLLTGNVSVTGRGASWPQIKPTLLGSGQLQLANGKLVGVNIVALAINGIAGAPGVSQLLNATFMSSHSGLLADPDTDLTNASLSFVLAGPRVTTHDLAVQSRFYGIGGDGWFDMDKNIDMDADIQLTFGLSVAIPVWVKGQLPAVIVLPNLPKLTERIAMGAINTPGRIIRGGVNAVGSIFGGGSSSPPPKSAPSSSLPNPLNALKSLIP